MDVAPTASTQEKGNLPSIEVDETKESGARPTNEVEGTIHIENEAEEELKQELEPVLEQLATHVPDLIVFRTHDAPLPQTIRSYGVVMFADISGFTALCEKYCNGSKTKSDGTDQLTSTLNSYLSQIVQAILEAGGDVLKFAGDALLALWSCQRFTASGMLSYVIQESLMMQNDFDNFQTPDGITLRMKIGLSVGKVDIHYLGNSDYKTFDVTGEAVDDVHDAQSLCKAGAVVISRSAWEMVNRQKCIATTVGSGLAQVNKMIPEDDNQSASAMTTLMSSEKRRVTLANVNQSKKSSRQSSGSKRYSEPIVGGATGHQNPWDDSKRISFAEVSGRKKSSMPGNLKEIGRGLNLRSGLKEYLMKLSQDAKDEMRCFILKTVVHKVEHGHEVSWLSELREVSVLFINLEPSSKDTLDTLQTSFDAVYPSLTKYDGSLNKVFMFDKGCTFLCIFGLPHAKHEDDTARSLRAAKEIFNKLGEMQLQYYAIGVTTGVAFCGVVGHPQRHEYTVIGQKVNMAARLMMKFPNCVTCDEVTMSKSNLPESQFTLAPPVTLKGISNPEKIYTFCTENVENLHEYKSDIHMESDADNLIGRDKEMSILFEELKHVSEHSHRDPGVIVISGGGGIGKTRLLKAMKANAASMGFRIVSGIGGLIEQNTPFFAVKTLITRLLELDSCKNLHDREQLILQHVTDEDLRQLLPLLNDLLVLKFPQTHITTHMTHKERTEGLHALLFRIVHQEALTKPCVFGIDDAHWIDPDSWAFLLDLALDPNAILVLTTRPIESIKVKHPAMLEILNHPHTILLNLQGLEPDHMIQLACSLLDVDSLPDVLQQIIRNKSHGVPLWCEELVETMLELEYLKVIEQEEIITESVDIKSVDSTIVEKTSDQSGELLEPENVAEQESNTSQRRRVVLRSKPRRKSTAHLSSGIGIGDIPIPDSVTGMVLTRIDHMSPSEQMTLKCAAVVGLSFSRSMLENVIPNCYPQAFHNSLNVLAEAGIIECAIAAEVRNLKSDISTRSRHHLPTDDPHLHCPCLNKSQTDHAKATIHHKHHISTHPPVDECEMFHFVHAYVQETAYGLWTESQRRTLHEAAALFLDGQAHKCKNCGGGGFVAGVPKQIDSAAKRKKSSTPAGRAFVGTANMKNKLRRKSTATGSRRGSRISTQGSTESTLASLTEIRNALESRQGRPSTSLSDGLETVAEHSKAVEDRLTGLRYESICESEALEVDMQDCHCDEIQAHIYPQLVRHWRAAGDMHKTLEYLIEAASAAVSTFNNMEAISLLQETKTILKELGSDIMSDLELARIESLIGQAFFQSGEIDESLPHFHHALHLLHSKLPTHTISSAAFLGYHAFKQLLHIKFPRRFLARKSGIDSQSFLDQARCMAHVTHAYHLQHKNMKTLMAALKQLNAAEEAQEDIHELIEAYATTIECCTLFNFKQLANHYLETAMSHCNDVQFGVEDIHTYAHLLSVALNSKLCQGAITEAMEIGTACYRVTSRMHDIAMELMALPLLFFTQMVAYQIEPCKESLKQLGEIASEADDLRAQALYDCCRFDALLEFGIGQEDATSLVKAAETCCTEDIYHFDDTERFFLVSCLALWYARQENHSSAEKYETIARGLIPKMFETYISVRALARFTECSLLLWRMSIDGSKWAKKALKLLKALSHKFSVFKPRYSLLRAYWKYTQRKMDAARKLGNKTVKQAYTCGCKFDEEWVEACMMTWFGKNKSRASDSDNPGMFILC